MSHVSRLRGAISLIELFVVLGIVALLLALLSAAILRAREASHRVVCAQHLHQIGLALHGYHDEWGRLPPGMSSDQGDPRFPWMGWQARILPQLGFATLWQTAERDYAEQPHVFTAQPPHAAFGTVIPLYSCPAEPRTQSPTFLAGGTRKVALTAYVGVAGLNRETLDGLFFKDSLVRWSDISDGTSQTLAVGERPPSADKILGWWYAGWGQARDGSAEMLLGVRERNLGTTVPMACPFGPYEFKAGRSDWPCDVFHFWSQHPSGGHFLFADGSVQFLSYDANAILPELATRSGGG